MTANLLAALLAMRLLSFDVADPPTPPDACTLLTTAEIAAALGAAPTPGRPESSVDEESKATTTSCSMTVGKETMFVVDVAEFSDVAASGAALKSMEKASQTTEGAVPMGPAAGVGEGALWGANEDGALWSVRKGKYMVSLVLAGVENPAEYQEPLKRLVTTVLAKL
jgi:hypothetical protein